MTSIINLSTFYIPLPHSWAGLSKKRNGTTDHQSATCPQQQRQQQQQHSQLPPRRAIRRRRNQRDDDDDEEVDEDEEASSSSSGSDGTSDSDSSSSSGEDDEQADDGGINLLQLGSAPSNMARTSNRPNLHDITSTTEDGYFSFWLILVSKSFMNTFTPIIVTEGTHELRELDLFLLSPTFEFANEIGFAKDVPNDKMISTLTKIRRFLKSVDRRGDVSDPRFIELLLTCPNLENINFDAEEKIPTVGACTSILDACKTLLEKHPNVKARGAGARNLAVCTFRTFFKLETHQWWRQNNVLALLRQTILERDRLRNPIAFRDYIACLESIVTIENAHRTNIPYDDIFPFSEFQDVIDYIEDIFNNGDEKYLLDPEVMPFILNLFVKIVSTLRIGNEGGTMVNFAPVGQRNAAAIAALAGGNNNANAAPIINVNPQGGFHARMPAGQNQRPHPCVVRKKEFIQRYRETLIPNVFKLLDICNLSGQLDLDITSRVFAFANCCVSDCLWADEFHGIPILDSNLWTKMIENGRKCLAHYPFEKLAVIAEKYFADPSKAHGDIFYLIFASVNQSAAYYLMNGLPLDEEVSRYTPRFLDSSLIKNYTNILMIEKDNDGERMHAETYSIVVQTLNMLVCTDESQFPNRPLFLQLAVRYFVENGILETLVKFFEKQTDIILKVTKDAMIEEKITTTQGANGKELVSSLKQLNTELLEEYRDLFELLSIGLTPVTILQECAKIVTKFKMAKLPDGNKFKNIRSKLLSRCTMQQEMLKQVESLFMEGFGFDMMVRGDDDDEEEEEDGESVSTTSVENWLNDPRTFSLVANDGEDGAIEVEGDDGDFDQDDEEGDDDEEDDFDEFDSSDDDDDDEEEEDSDPDGMIEFIQTVGGGGLFGLSRSANRTVVSRAAPRRKPSSKKNAPNAKKTSSAKPKPKPKPKAKKAQQQKQKKKAKKEAPKKKPAAKKAQQQRKPKAKPSGKKSTTKKPIGKKGKKK